MSFPDAENMVREFLQQRLDGVPVSTRVPNPRPTVFVRVWRTGGAAMNRVLDEPLITVECWADDDGAAVKNANSARSVILEDSVGMALVRSVSDRSGIYYDPDPVSGSPRYTFTVELRVRRSRS